MEQFFLRFVEYAAVPLLEASPYPAMLQAFMFYPGSPAGIQVIAVGAVLECADIRLQVL